ncbi:MAG TPA: pteridine reductase [Rhodocyclaceae bacterium]|jgi:pteridine reductase|nr:pteridine reductase [Rhodocyclaceae bacterium]
MYTPVILVTGAGRRVGAEIARTLHAAGAKVMLHYRSARLEAEALALELNQTRPDSAAVVHAELNDAVALAAVVELTVSTFGRLDGVVNNASSFFPTPVGSIDEDAWDNLIGSNLKGPLFLSQAAAPHLKQTHGCIINITDIHAERPLKNYPLYCAAKAGLLGLTRALALELGPEVRVNAISPGPIAWPEGESFSLAERKTIIDHTLLKKAGSPADIAGAVKFLLLDAPYVTGQVLNVDGGRTAHL